MDNADYTIITEAETINYSEFYTIYLYDKHLGETHPSTYPEPIRTLYIVLHHELNEAEGTESVKQILRSDKTLVLPDYKTKVISYQTVAF
jgi:hypothetical protein